ncbi:MAG: hypothetical protein Tsb0013_21610 [Phycisphaerales bacterium]
MSHDHHDAHHLHVTPFWPMLIVFVALLGLTALTVYTANLHEIVVGNTTIEIGATAHIFIAMAIAIVKSALVMGFFMHLLYDKLVNTIVVASTLFAVSLFIGLTLMDLAVRDSIEKVEGQEMTVGGTDEIVRKSVVRGEAAKADEHAHDEQSGDGAKADDASH